jgi:hypothetical protein
VNFICVRLFAVGNYYAIDCLHLTSSWRAWKSVDRSLLACKSVERSLLACKSVDGSTTIVLRSTLLHTNKTTKKMHSILKKFVLSELLLCLFEVFFYIFLIFFLFNWITFIFVLLFLLLYLFYYFYFVFILSIRFTTSDLILLSNQHYLNPLFPINHESIQKINLSDETVVNNTSPTI